VSVVCPDHGLLSPCSGAKGPKFGRKKTKGSGKILVGPIIKQIYQKGQKKGPNFV
jgi:hypothetical protein